DVVEQSSGFVCRCTMGVIRLKWSLGFNRRIIQFWGAISQTFHCLGASARNTATFPGGEGAQNTISHTRSSLRRPVGIKRKDSPRYAVPSFNAASDVSSGRKLMQPPQGLRRYILDGRILRPC